MVEQAWIKLSQRGAVTEEDVGAVLGLIDHPVVAAWPQPSLAEERVDLPGPTVEDFDPVEMGKALGQLLGFVGLIELGESVVVLHETKPALGHLSRQPIVAVD